ncbi:MAG: hypothetical protein JW940_14900 [Polyangiaceae bacterium]|nr:hypothetical protein [Polyangiaceae bacterium]
MKHLTGKTGLIGDVHQEDRCLGRTLRPPVGSSKVGRMESGPLATITPIIGTVRCAA